MSTRPTTFLKLNTQHQRAEYIASYQTGGGQGTLSGQEEILLLLDNTSSDDIATFLYKDTQKNVHVGAFQSTGGNQGQFTHLTAMGESQSQELLDAQWYGPYDNLVGTEKNVFFAVLEGTGIQVFQFDGIQLTLISHIENGHSFGNFVYRYPKLTIENVKNDRTAVFDVITPQAP